MGKTDPTTHPTFPAAVLSSSHLLQLPIASERDFPLSLEQMNKLIQNPSDFAGLSIEQTNKVKDMIKSQINGKISKVELTDLR